MDVKIDRYRQLPSCEAILIVEQGAMDAKVLIRSGESWSEAHVTDPDEDVAIEAVGLRCQLRDFYALTPIGRSAE